jgi:hypothetical protein
MKRFAGFLFALLITLAHSRAQAEKTHDSLGAAWDHFNGGRYDEGLAVIDQALPGLEAEAKKQAAGMRGFDAKGHERERGALNTAGTLSLIRARIFEKQGRDREALAAYQQVVADYPFAQSWDPGGWFWHPAEDAKKRSYMCLLRSAVKSRRLDEKFFPQKEDAFDVPAERTAVSWVAGELLAANDFQGLEFMAESARTRRIRLSNGDGMLHAFYLGIEDPYPVQKTEEDWKKWGERLRQWRDAAPKSVTPRIATAKYLTRYAWHVRGSGFANTVKPEAWPIFEERLADAARVLKDTPRKCPEWYQAMSNVALGQGWDLKAYDEIFDEGWKAFPGYSPLVESKTYYLLPRWHGKPGEWHRFAVEFARKNGAEYYVAALNYVSRFEDEDTFHVDQDLLRRGWEAKIKQNPGSLALLHGYTRTLAKLDDPHAGEWFDKIGDTYHAATWSSYSRLEEARAQAKKQ